MAIHNEIGKLGERIVSKWLSGQGYRILDRNYRKRFGEIDIVARETAEIMHFIEVKTVSYETRSLLEWAVSHETWRPEEMVHREKQRRFLRTIEAWLVEHAEVSQYQIDVATVRMVPREKYARVKLLKNLVFEP
jgi:putative endonuclease